ncbi:MAG: CoA pyrophosphatase [Chloroflexi bacterium]|nr:CoA pyrophosphatase [Chloroflexota bacterium]
MNKDTIRTMLAKPETEQEIPEGFWRRASVLALFTESGEGLSLLFTRRTDHVVDHKGQVSFPGGAVEPNDESLEVTALRETFEEIGIKPAEIEILGRSKDMFTISGWWITPIVGWYTKHNGFNLNPIEVTRVFTIPVEWLRRKENWYYRSYERDGIVRENVIFYKEFDGEILWGITAHLVHDLLEKIEIIEK